MIHFNIPDSGFTQFLRYSHHTCELWSQVDYGTRRRAERRLYLLPPRFSCVGVEGFICLSKRKPAPTLLFRFQISIWKNFRGFYSLGRNWLP